MYVAVTAAPTASDVDKYHNNYRGGGAIAAVTSQIFRSVPT